MHLMLAVRGINKEFEEWKKWMETQMFEFRQWPLLKTKKGEYIKEGDDSNGQPILKHGPLRMPIERVQGSLRPIQLFEYVFPQESLQEVLAMMDLNKNYNNLRPEINKIGWLLRKATGAKKIPDMPDLQKKERWEVTKKMIPHDGVAVYPLGIKEDITQAYIFNQGKPGEQGIYQEGL